MKLVLFLLFKIYFILFLFLFFIKWWGNSPRNIRCLDIWVTSGSWSFGIINLAMMSTKEMAKQKFLLWLEKLTQVHYSTPEMESFSPFSTAVQGYGRSWAGCWELNINLIFFMPWFVFKPIFMLNSRGDNICLKDHRHMQHNKISVSSGLVKLTTRKTNYWWCYNVC